MTKYVSAATRIVTCMGAVGQQDLFGSAAFLLDVDQIQIAEHTVNYYGDGKKSQVFAVS